MAFLPATMNNIDRARAYYNFVSDGPNQRFTAAMPPNVLRDLLAIVDAGKLVTLGKDDAETLARVKELRRAILRAERSPPDGAHS